MSGKLTNEQLEKMIARWIAAKGDHTFDFSVVPDDRVKEVRERLDNQKMRWELDKLKADHIPEIVHQAGDAEKGQRMSRIKTTLGHVYFQTVWMNGALSSSMCFVPNIIIETDQERPAYE